MLADYPSPLPGTSPRLIALGTDYRHASVEVREQMAFPDETLNDALRDLQEITDEGMILSTCNRVEIYAVVRSSDLSSATMALRRFIAEQRNLSVRDVIATTTTFSDEAAARHAFRVAAGLESMVLGEPQILGQVRDALAAAQAAGAAGPTISRLATEALRIGKRARTVTDIARNKTSISHAAVALAARELTHGCPLLVAVDKIQKAELPCPSPIAHGDPFLARTGVVVGAGPMADLAARLLRAGKIGQLVIANRTVSRAEDLAHRTRGTAIGLDRLPEALAKADFAIVATGAASPVITAETLTGHDALWAARERPLLMIDVGVPRSVDPDLAADSRVMIRDMDDLEPIANRVRDGYSREIARVEGQVEDAVALFAAWFEARSVTPTIAALNHHADRIREVELTKALGRLGHLSERDREVVRALAVGITNKLLHQPMTELQRPENPDRLAEAATLERLFGLEAEHHEHRPASVRPHVASEPTEPDRHLQLGSD